MSDTEGLMVELPPAVAETVRAAVDDGEYASTTEAVCDALRLWQEQREALGWSAAELKKAWDEGKASGPPEPLDIEAIIAEARAERESGQRG